MYFRPPSVCRSMKWCLRSSVLVVNDRTSHIACVAFMDGVRMNNYTRVVTSNRCSQGTFPYISPRAGAQTLCKRAAWIAVSTIQLQHIKLMPNLAATNTRCKIGRVATERWLFVLCLVGSEAILPTMKHELSPSLFLGRSQRLT